MTNHLNKRLNHFTNKVGSITNFKRHLSKAHMFFFDIYIKLLHVPSLLILTQVKEIIVLHVLLISKAFGCDFC
jgi:hypothetical protein